MYRNILVPVAPEHPPTSGEALAVARTLLTEGGKITALTVLEAIPAYIAHQLPDDIVKQNLKEAEIRLKSDLGGIKGAKAAVIVGHAASSILDFAKAQDSDCIIIASHRPGLQDYFLGSTAARVVRHAQCAVHVVR